MKNKLCSENGFIMVMVVAVVISMMVLTLGLLSRTSTQSISSNQMVKEIQAKQYARGIWWRVYNRMNDGEVCPDGDTGSDTLNGTTFTYTISCVGTEVDVNVDWD